MPEPPRAKWNIERVELVLFNLEHKRWQIWQEHSPQSLSNAAQSIDPRYRTGAVFRRQIIRLLDSVRMILKESIEISKACSRFSISEHTPSESSRVKEEINLVFSAGAPCKPVFWQLFLDYCDLTCNKYGIISPNVRKLFQNNNFRSGNFTIPTPLTRDDAADIISVLPVAANWDLFGCWYRSWTKEGAKYHFPPSANGAADWNHPFYMARISQSKKTSYLETLLGTVVETICCDLGSSALIPIHCEADKFFGRSYCTLPSGSTLAGQTYLAYAYLYDHIQTARGFKASYIISFPIEVYDRTHFLQIQIAPEHLKSSGESLGQLWVDWIGSVHQSFWVFPVRQYLEEEIQRLALAYFESRWEDALSKELETWSDPDLDLDKTAISTGSHPVLSKTLAETAHLLLPLNAVHEIRRKKRWTYQPYSWEHYYHWRQTQISPLSPDVEKLFKDFRPPRRPVGHLGAAWREGKPIKKDDTGASHSDLSFEPDYGEDALSGVKNNVVRSRIDQLVDLHSDRMSFQMRQMIAFTKDQRSKAKILLREYFSDPANRGQFGTSLSGDLAKKVHIADPKLGDQSVYSLMHLATGQKPADEIFNELERRLLQQPISEITSAFFSLGAAKVLTHTDRWLPSCSLTTEEMKDVLNSDLDRLMNSL